MSLVRTQREAAGLSLSEVARRAGMLVSKVWKIEHEELALKARDIAALARAIGCDPRELIPPETPAHPEKETADV